jgi:ABC-2 type transport system ATP-binding protein
MIELRGVGKRFYDLQALDNICLSLKSGEITLLLGPNGAGKTTIHHCLSGVLFPDVGELFYGDQQVTTGSGIPYSIGYLGDRDCLEPDLKVREFLLLMARLKNQSAPKVEADKWLENFHLSDVANQRIASLSLGFKQRVSLAQACMGDPDLLLLDEPGNALDPQEFRNLENLLLIEKKQRIVLVSTHRIREAERIADRLVFLDQGKILRQGHRNELLKSLIKPGFRIQFSTPSPQFSKFLADLEIDYQTEDQRVFLFQPDGAFQANLFDFLKRNNLEIEQFKTLKPDLEEVFFKAYREGGQ